MKTSYDITDKDVKTLLSHVNSHMERIYEGQETIFPKRRKDVCLVVRGIHTGMNDETLYLLYKNKKGVDYMPIIEKNYGKIDIKKFSMENHGIRITATGSDVYFNDKIPLNTLGLK